MAANELHMPYVEWNPQLDVWSIFHNGGIQAYGSAGELLVFADRALAVAYLEKAAHH